MLRRIVWFVVAFPVAVLLVTLALANRHGVRLVLDPFRPADPTLSLVLPFYAYLFGALLLGVVIGGLATWIDAGAAGGAARGSATVEAQSLAGRGRPAGPRARPGARGLAAA